MNTVLRIDLGSNRRMPAGGARPLADPILHGVTSGCQNLLKRLGALSQIVEAIRVKPWHTGGPDILDVHVYLESHYCGKIEVKEQFELQRQSIVEGEAPDVIRRPLNLESPEEIASIISDGLLNKIRQNLTGYIARSESDGERLKQLLGAAA